MQLVHMTSKACLIEVEAFPDNQELGSGRKRAFVNLYLRAVPGLILDAAIAEACEFNGFRFIELCSVRDMPELEIPKEAIDGYNRFGAGFGTFQTFPDAN